MIARSIPYALTPFQETLDSVLAQVAAALAAVQAQMAMAEESRALFEGMTPAEPGDWTPGDPWGGQFDGQRLVVCGPQALMTATFDGSTLQSLKAETPEVVWEVEPAGPFVKVNIANVRGGTSASFVFGPEDAGRDGTTVDLRIGALESEWKRAIEAEAQRRAEEAAAAAEAEEAARAEAARAEAEAAAAFAAPPVPAQPEKQWYYAVAGKTEGPLPESELRRLMAGLPPDALVWTEGFATWKKPAEAGLLPAIPAMPPPPPPPLPFTAAPPVQPAAAKAPEAELVVKAPEPGRYALAAESRIGRSAECEVALADGLASRVHAVVRKQADGYWVSDNQSLNGTEVNGVRITQAVKLKAGDVIRVASYELEFQPGETEQPSVAATARFSVGAAAPVEAAPVPAPEPFDFFGAPAPQPAAAATGVPCRHCAGQNKPDANFCIHCGKKLG